MPLIRSNVRPLSRYVKWNRRALNLAVGSSGSDPQLSMLPDLMESHFFRFLGELTSAETSPGQRKGYGPTPIFPIGLDLGRQGLVDLDEPLRLVFDRALNNLLYMFVHDDQPVGSGPGSRGPTGQLTAKKKSQPNARSIVSSSTIKRSRASCRALSRVRTNCCASFS